MSQIPTNIGAKQVSHANTAGAVGGSKFQEFFVSIGKGLAKAGKAVAHFFGTSVPTFFKSLGQRTATQVDTTDTTRSGAITGTKTTGTSNVAKNVFGKSASMNNIDWVSASTFETHDSGHGGVSIVDVGGARCVIKNAGGGSSMEVFGARLAKEVGLKAPETRLLTKIESTAITNRMAELGASLPKRGDTEASMVMQYVDGVPLGEIKTDAKGAKALAQNIGKWLAFDAVISEQDRFHGFVTANSPNGINSANFMVDPNNLSGGFIGIDSNTSPTDSTKTINNIETQSEFFFLGVAQALLQQIDAPGVTADDLIDDIMNSANSMLKHIGDTLTNQKIDQLSSGLTFGSDVVTAIKQRVATL